VTVAAIANGGPTDEEPEADDEDEMDTMVAQMAAQQVEQEAPNRTMWQEEDQQRALNAAVAAPVVPSPVGDGLASDESDADSVFDAEEMAEAGALGMEGGGGGGGGSDDGLDEEGGGGPLPVTGPQQEIPDDFPMKLHEAHRELNYYHVRSTQQSWNCPLLLLCVLSSLPQLLFF
jgi:hypothetical protein